MTDEQRLAAFERMLAEVQAQAEREKALMDTLKAQGKEKSATYRQYMGNRLMYARIFSMFREYGLME